MKTFLITLSFLALASIVNAQRTVGNDTIDYDTIKSTSGYTITHIKSTNMGNTSISFGTIVFDSLNPYYNVTNDDITHQKVIVCASDNGYDAFMELEFEFNNKTQKTLTQSLSAKTALVSALKPVKSAEIDVEKLYIGVASNGDYVARIKATMKVTTLEGKTQITRFDDAQHIK